MPIGPQVSQRSRSVDRVPLVNFLAEPEKEILAAGSVEQWKAAAAEKGALNCEGTRDRGDHVY